MNRIYFITMIYAFLGFQVACTKKEEPGLYSVYQLDKYKQEKPIITLDEALWEKQNQLMIGFPKGITVYRRTASINGKGVNAYLLAFNPKTDIDFKPILSSAGKTPTTFYEEEGSDVYACLNGGYFYGNTSLSLVMYRSVLSSQNVLSLNRTHEGTSKTYYPTRSAFGLSDAFQPSVAWVYNVSNDYSGLYSYPTVSPNAEGQAPMARPSSAFPTGGVTWSRQAAIGGSPMLVKDSLVQITDVEEMITTSVTPSASRPRSAIGYLKNGNVVLMAVQGGTTDIPGLTLQELAEEMLAVGCVGAINLDGGGSTSFIINGEQTVEPSDATGERKVISALIIKKR